MLPRAAGSGGFRRALKSSGDVDLCREDAVWGRPRTQLLDSKVNRDKSKAPKLRIKRYAVKTDRRCQRDRGGGSPLLDEPRTCRCYTHQPAYRAHLRDRRVSRVADHPGTPPLGRSFFVPT